MRDAPQTELNLVLIDNHDSFTGILAHLIHAATGTLPRILPNDDPELSLSLLSTQDAVIISPGPGSPHDPEDLGASALALSQRDVPVLGICLGMQAIAVSAGGRVERAPFPVHGRTSTIEGFAGLEGPLHVTRYHSLAVDPASLPGNVTVTSLAEDGTIMALRRNDAPHYGIQFHPESAGTHGGAEILRALFAELGVPLPVRTHWHSEELVDAPPLAALAAALDGQAKAVAWLDSSDAEHPTGQRSLLALDMGLGQSGMIPPAAVYEHARHLPEVTVSGTGDYRPGLFCVLSYEADRALLVVPDVVIVADATGTWLYRRDGVELPEFADRLPAAAPQPKVVTTPAADHSREQYLAAVRACQEYIGAGESYELCLTTTVRTRLADVPDPLQLYLRLRDQAPAPMAAFWRIGDTALLSASPERFMRVDEHRLVHASPIKGTSSRGTTPATDRANALALRNSAKDRAENQMIVDLMRHDIAAWCEPGSVTVPELCRVHTFATGHQMISTVSGRLRREAAAHEVIVAAHPPGSMTGAPKKRTVQLLQTLEPNPRGWYSGIGGHITADGTADSSVLIRTVELSGDTLTYGAGGAVTALSDPDAEADEVQVKLLPLRRLLGYEDNDDDWLEGWT